MLLLLVVMLRWLSCMAPTDGSYWSFLLAAYEGKGYKEDGPNLHELSTDVF